MRKVIVDEKEIEVPGVESWDDVASDVLKNRKGGDILAITGPLGAGKTTFVQALAAELGIKKTPQSPTFSLMRSYAIPRHETLKRLVHVDAYRTLNENELLALDLDEELLEPGTLLVIEWPDKIPHWIARHVDRVISVTILSP